MKLAILFLAVFISACTNNLLSSGVKIDFPRGYGSGTVIEVDGELLILTVNHVIEDEDIKNAAVMWFDQDLVARHNEFGFAGVSVEVVAADKRTDLAILRPLEELPQSLKPAKLASLETLITRSDPVTIVASPFELPPFITTGHIITPNAIRKEDGVSRLIITALASNGSSGGGVFKGGELIGVVTQIFQETSPVFGTGLYTAHITHFMTIAVPVSYVHELITEIKHGK